MVFDALIIGGGVSGMQCALVLGSAYKNAFASDKKIAIILHQRASHLENALFNNVLGLQPNTLGKDILTDGKEQLATLYPHVSQLENEKVLSIIQQIDETYVVETNKNRYKSKIVVVALNYAKPFSINGLDKYVIPHQKSSIDKDRIQLKNEDHLIKKGLYCCGTIAGFRSQFAIAAGSGASVATDILTLWNDGKDTKVHDKVLTKV